MADELIGKSINGYDIEDKIGQGGMATVYRARQTSMNRVVALKVLPRHFMKDDTYLQRFEREVKIVAQLEHRNIISVYDYGEFDGQPYIAMRYMAAGSVDDLVAHGPMSPADMLSIVEQIAPALDYAHTKNVLHRDLKPSNVLMDDNGGAYITDFGIARMFGAENKGSTITTQGVVGTPSYMSPEQAQGHDLDGRSDIYSLGVMLFEMATSRRPFENETPYSIAVMQVTTPPPLPRGFNPELSKALEKVIIKSLNKKPDNRYQTGADLARAIKQAIESPDSIFDTQPRPIQIQDKLESTQPSNTSNDQQATVPSPPLVAPVPQTPVPQFNPPSSAGSQPVRPSYAPPPRRRKKRGMSMWTGMLVGGVIGCGVLSIVAIVVAFAVGNFFNDDDVVDGVTPSAEPGVTEQVGVDIPPLDATSQAARDDLFGTQSAQATDEGSIFGGNDLTPTFAAVGERPIPTVDPDYDAESGRIIYFALREDEDSESLNYDIYYYDLALGVETRLTDSPFVDSYPMVSPDGTQIVFQSNRGGDFEIYVMNIDGSDVTRITTNDILDRLPAWSPDGEWIIYSSDTNDDDNLDLYRIRADGSGVPELLLSNGVRNSHPRYSPDGRSVVFTTGSSADSLTWEIGILDLESGDVSYLTDNDVRDASPSYSPDGERVIYVTDGEGGASVVTRRLDETAPMIVLEDHQGREWGANYSPDGNYVIYNSEQAGLSDIFYFPASGGDSILIENDGGFYPSWVP